MIIWDFVCDVFCMVCFFFDVLVVGFVLSCVEVGVVGFLFGVLGSMMVLEVIKLIVGIGMLLCG